MSVFQDLGENKDVALLSLFGAVAVSSIIYLNNLSVENGCGRLSRDTVECIMAGGSGVEQGKPMTHSQDLLSVDIG